MSVSQLTEILFSSTNIFSYGLKIFLNFWWTPLRSVVLTTPCKWMSWLLRIDRDSPTYQKMFDKGTRFVACHVGNLLRITLYDV